MTQSHDAWPSLSHLLTTAGMREAIEESFETAANQTSMTIEMDRLKSDIQTIQKDVADLNAKLAELTQTVFNVRRDVIRIKHCRLGQNPAADFQIGQKAFLKHCKRYLTIVAILFILILLIFYL